jgi:vacuolar-type H+-ATPase subunit H
MDDMLDNAKAFPLAAHKIVIDGDRLRELVNDVRLNLPKEMKRARDIDYDCDRVMKEAESKAENIIHTAEERAKSLVAENAIVEEAKRRAHEILTKTKGKCEETKDATSAYVLQSLTATEAKLNTLLADLRKEKGNWEK